MWEYCLPGRTKMAFSRFLLEAEPYHRTAGALAEVDPDFAVAETDSHPKVERWTQTRELAEGLAEEACAISTKVVVPSIHR